MQKGITAKSPMEKKIISLSIVKQNKYKKQ